MSCRKRPLLWSGQTLFLVGLMTLASTNLFNTAMVRGATPSIRAEYGIGVSELAWVGTGFFLPYVVLMPVVGNLADLYGRKRVLLAGFLLFLVGTLACASLPRIPDWFWGEYCRV